MVEGRAPWRWAEQIRLLRHREPRLETVADLVGSYRASPEYKKLRPLTRRDYDRQLLKVANAFGDLSLRAVNAREIPKWIHEWRDRLAGSPRQADYAVQVLKVLLAWGVRRGLFEHNRAEKVGRLYRGDRRERTWSSQQVEAFQRSAPEPLVRALMVALETGQRQGDLLTLQWSAIDDGVLRLRQSKTGARVAVPISEALTAHLPCTPTSVGPILTKADGRAWDNKGNGFRAALRDACRAAGITGVTFHDLRGTFVTRRLAEGWSTLEVAMCTGHSLRDLAMLDTYADRAIVADASAERVRERTAYNALQRAHSDIPANHAANHEDLEAAV